jgi:hypothetical protein
MKIRNNKVVKPKNRIFNFPLSSTDRGHLEELAEAWGGLSLAGAIRRSLITAYESLNSQRSTPSQEMSRESQLKTLEIMLALHTELTNTRTKMENIISLINSGKQETIAQLNKLNKPVHATAVQVSALIKGSTNREQIESEIQKIISEKRNVTDFNNVGMQ